MVAKKEEKVSKRREGQIVQTLLRDWNIRMEHCLFGLAIRKVIGHLYRDSFRGEVQDFRRLTEQTALLQSLGEK